MAESETIKTKSDLLLDLKEITRMLCETENELYQEKQQRALNTPYIRQLQKRVTFLQINSIHIRDRLNKLDGCF